MKKGQISVQTENIFPIIKKFLYSDQEIFLRELISNAVDATTKLKTLAARGDFKEKLGDLTIHVQVDKEKGTITISDRGIGMDADEVMKYLNQVAFSSARDFLEQYKDDSGIIGHFGLGFYSAFMVAERVEVKTNSYKAEADPVIWTCDGSPEYTLDSIDKEDRGTDVVLYLSEDASEYLEEERIQQLLDKYCKFLPIEIQFGTRTETRYEGEGDDKEEIKEEVPNIINNPNPIWRKQPAELTDEDYKSFYNELYPFSRPPLFWIHLNIDFPFNLTGILYFPEIAGSIELQKNKIQLYSNQVFVTDDVSAIVPEFLTLLHGVVDSPDIPLNVSRSYLQADRNVKKITGYITKKVAEKLRELFNADRKDYEGKWKDIGMFVKYGMLTDEKFFERAQKFALLKNTGDKFYTIEEHKEEVKETQTDKYDRVVFVYTSDPKDQAGFVENAKNEGLNVLVLDHMIDNHFAQHLETKLDGVTFVRVDSDVPENLVQKDQENESVLNESQVEKVKTLFKDRLEIDEYRLHLKPMSPNTHPVLITKPEFIRRMNEMQAMQGMNMDMGDQGYNVVVNTNHPLIAEKLLRMRSEDKKSSFVQYMYDLARLNQGMLKGKDMNAFIERSLEFAG